MVMMARSWLSGEVFVAGDIVTRGGSDRHLVIEADDDMLEVECIAAPASGWCAVGERERNLARRYSHLPAIVGSLAAEPVERP